MHFSEHSAATLFRNASSFLVVIPAKLGIPPFRARGLDSGFRRNDRASSDLLLTLLEAVLSQGGCRVCFWSHAIIPQTRVPKRAWGSIPRCKVRFMRKPEALFSTVLTWVLLAGASPLLAQDDEIRWLDNYREAIQEAKRTQKPIFLEFRCEP